MLKLLITLCLLFGQICGLTVSTKFTRKQNAVAGAILQYQYDIEDDVECMVQCGTMASCNVARYDVQSRVCTYIGNGFYVHGNPVDGNQQQFIATVRLQILEFCC